MNLLLEEIIKVVAPTHSTYASTVEVSGVSIDSRTVSKGDLFFAIKGDNFDGSSFIEDAKSKGAVGAIVNSDVSVSGDKDFAVIKVEDTVKVLGELAKYYRNKLDIKIIAVTGSAGKTTTKDFIYSILVSGGFKVVKTLGNFNNLIGLPLSIFKFEEDTCYGILELGINEVGEMEQLAGIASPDVALITNIGRSHLEGLGSVEIVAEEKKKLFKATRSGGSVIVNIDDIRLSDYAPEDGVAKKTFGLTVSNSAVDVGIKNVSMKDDRLIVNYGIDGKDIEVKIDTPYQCNAYNGASAICSVLAMDSGFSLDAIKGGLESYSQADGRMSIFKSSVVAKGGRDASGITIIDDSYNSNPESLKEALKALSCVEVGVTGKRIAVIGDMLELGDDSKQYHREAGEFARVLGIDTVVAVGEFAEVVVSAIEGDENVKIYTSFDSKSASSLVADIARVGDAVLVKGSRSMKMEMVVERLKSI